MDQLLIYQSLRDLFSSFEVLCQSRVFAAVSQIKVVDERAAKLEYDYLLKGTCADIYIPLWASACQGDGKILWNHTTLEVITFYARYGYQPISIDGNPPDYIGEMFRFLVYLESARRSEVPPQQDLQAAKEQLMETYLLPVLKEVSAGFGKYASQLTPLSEFLEQLVINRLDIAVKVDEAIKVSLLPCCEFAEVRRSGLNKPVELSGPEQINTAGINNCGGICVIRPTVREGCILKIETDVLYDRPDLKACVKGRGYHKTFLNSERIRYPMKRVGERGAGTFERISWDEAVSLLTAEWRRIRASYGEASRYVMYATGVTGIMNPKSLIKRLLSLDGGFLDYYNSYSSACARFITPYIYGTADSGNSMADLLNTKLLILWGHNPVETQFGTERRSYLNQLKKQGVKIIVIDPRYSDTAASYGDQWIPIRPSTDSALADALAYVIWTEGWQDQQFMDRYCIGFDEAHMPEGIPAGESYQSYLLGIADGIPKTPQWAEKICGVPARTIWELARDYALTKPACLLVGLGLQRTRNGEQTIRSTALLTCLTGNVGIPGGNAGGTGGLIEHQRLQLTDRVENPFKGEIPVFQWSKAVEQGVLFDSQTDGLTGVNRLDTNIKMIFNLAGNTLVNQHSDINKTISLLKDTSKCEFIVCSDLFFTASARYADLLLPGTSVFEGNNMVNPWSGANYFLYNNQVIEPLFECRFEWEWMKELAQNLNLYEAFTAGKPELEMWLCSAYEKLRETESELPEYSVMKQRGGWQYQKPVHYIAYENEIKDPEHYPFKTPSGKIEIFSKQLYEKNQPEQIPAIPKYVPCKEGPEDPDLERYPLQLIGWHTKRRCHSIHDNNEWMDEVETPALWIHPDDAAARNLSDGDMAEVFNDRGIIRIPVKVTRRIMAGVIALSQGGWYRPDQNGTDLRGSINVLTESDHPSPLAKGNPQHTNLAQVRRYNHQL